MLLRLRDLDLRNAPLLRLLVALARIRCIYEPAVAAVGAAAVAGRGVSVAVATVQALSLLVGLFALRTQIRGGPSS